MFFLLSRGWHPACGKMPFLIQKAPLCSEGVAATPSGNVIQPKVMLREGADPWLICSSSEELWKEESQLHWRQEWLCFIGKSNPRETQVPPGEARAACSVAASISRNFVAKREREKEYSTICFYFWSCLCTRQLTSATCSPFAQRMFSLPSSPILPFSRRFFLLHDSLRRWTVSLWFLCAQPYRKKTGWSSSPFPLSAFSVSLIEHSCIHWTRKY